MHDEHEYCPDCARAESQIIRTHEVPPQHPHLRVQVYVDSRGSTPEQGMAYVHCVTCIKEWDDGKAGEVSPKDYARLQVSQTEDGGFQVWCVRHDQNVGLIRFRAEYLV